MNLDDAIHEITRARKRLAAGQGRLARKNARAAVKAAIAAVLRAMDREYPIMRKERVVRVSMSPIAKKRRERARRAHIVLVTTEEALKLAGLGVKTKPYTGGGTTGPRHEVPRWASRALNAGIHLDSIQQAVRSPAARRRIEGLLRLRNA